MGLSKRHIWRGTPSLDRLVRALHRPQTAEKRNSKQVNASVTSGTPDLFVNNDNLREITQVRDAVRGLRREARMLDLESDHLPGTCEADIRVTAC